MNARKAYCLIGICGVLLLAALAMASAGAAQAPAQESVAITLQAPPYRLVPTEDGYTEFDIDAEGYSLAGQPGQALLPHRYVDVALPPDVAWDSLSLAVVDVRAAPLPGALTLRAAVPDASASGPAAYSEPAGQPSIARIAATGQMRKWRLARVDFSPFRYDPASGELSVVEQVTVELRFARTGRALDAALMDDSAMDDRAAERLINYGQALAWYPPARRAPQAIYNYIIMTTNAIEANSAKLDNFIAAKTAKGYSVLVVTEDDYGGLTGPAPNGREEKVRLWLQNNYATMNILYVLLIGEPTPGGSGATSMPMKMCWPRRGSGSDEESPTDYFYADLTGDWDVDNDTFYGEYTDDFGPAGGVNFDAEVFVGRIPFYGSYADLDAILQKMIDYGIASPSAIAWRDNVLLPMSFSEAGYDGAPLAEQMWDDYLNGGGYSRWRQYQQGGGACGVNSSYVSEEELRGGTVVRDRWAVNHYGIVCWWGHGSATSASVGYSGCWDGTLFDNTQTASLNDSYPSFTYQCSCTNGYPENSANLQYSILKRGGIATVSASRVSWYNSGVGYGDFDGSTTNSGIGYEYVQNLAAGIPAGESLFWAKMSMTPASNTRLMNYYDFNLYGDPSIAITAHGTPADNRVYLPLLFKACDGDAWCGLPVVEGFEAGKVPPGRWAVQQSNPNQTWKIAVYGAPHIGVHMADVEYDAALGLQNEALISPPFSAANAQLSFWSYGSLFWCRDDNDNCDLNVWLVVGEWGDGGEIFLGRADDGWTDNWQWTNTTIDLSPYLPDGVVARIVFQYYGQNGAQIALDDVQITGVCPDACPVDSQFNGSADNWVSHSGTWYIGSEYLYTEGLAGMWSSASYYAAKFGDFDYQARLRRLGCQTCANYIVFRGTPDPLTPSYNWYHEYKLQYSADGQYSVWRRLAGGGATALVGWTYTSAIVPGDNWNTLRAVADGPHLTFYINGVYLWSGVDTSLTNGRVGVGMYDGGSGNELDVDWAKLCTVTPGRATPPEPPPPAGPTVPGDESRHY